MRDEPKAVRLVLIIDMLEQRWFTVLELAERFEVDRQTIAHDLRDLKRIDCISVAQEGDKWRVSRVNGSGK